MASPCATSGAGPWVEVALHEECVGRAGHATTQRADSRGHLYLLGGHNPSSGCYYNDVWRLHVPSGEWLRQPWDGPWSPRAYHTATLLERPQGQRQLWVVGGTNGHKCFDELWVLDLESETWQNVGKVSMLPLVILARLRFSLPSDTGSSCGDGAPVG